MTGSARPRPWAVRGLRDRPPEGITLHVCDLDSDADMPLALAWDLLVPDEAARARRMRKPADQARQARARAFLRRTLGAALRVDPRSVRLDQGPNGKPELAHPRPAAAPEFNLSHSGGVAVLALSRIGPVGIDIERPERPFDPLDLAVTVLCPEETATLGALPEADRMERFLLYWMAKEARMKLTGEGMALAPGRIALALGEGGVPRGVQSPLFPAVDIHIIRVPGRREVCAIATARSAGEVARCA